MFKHKAVVFDLDGVLASNDHLMHHIKCATPDWDSFNAGLRECQPIKEWVVMTHLLHTEHAIIILTNRSEHLAGITQGWLGANYVHYDKIVMRPPGTPYSESKTARMIDICHHYRVALAIEDDPAIVEAYRLLGIPTILVNSGYYVGGLTAGVESADVTQ